MIAFTILYLSLGYSLYGIIMEETTQVFRDFRFWLVIVCLIILVMLTLESYPI